MRVTPMVNYISALVFIVLLIVGVLIAAAIAQAYPLIAALFALLWLFLDVIVCSSIRLAAQWEKAVVFRLGKYHTMKGPGLFMVVPLIDQIWIVDTRVLAVSIPKQQVILWIIPMTESLPVLTTILSPLIMPWKSIYLVKCVRSRLALV